MKSHRPQIQVSQRSADLQITQEHAGLIEISKTASQLFIDQSEAFADANLKGPLRRSNEFVQQAQQKAMEYLAKAAQEGEQMMKIEHGGNAIARIAKNHSGMINEVQLEMSWIPSSPDKVKMSYQPSELQISVKKSEANINVTRNEPTVSVPKWQTDVYMRQKNSMQMQVVGLNVNRSL